MSVPRHTTIQSTAAVLELSVLCDGELGGVCGRQAVAQVVHAVALLHLGEGTHQPGVSCIQGADPLFLQDDRLIMNIEQARGKGREREMVTR